MTVSSVRDRFDLRRQDLLEDYAAISKKRRGAAEATSLRLRSRQYLDIMATEASKGTHSWRSLEALLDDPDAIAEQTLEPMILAEIGRVLLLQQFDPGDLPRAVVALEYGIDRLPKNMKSRRFRKLLVDHYVVQGQASRALELLDAWPDVNRDVHRYLRAELQNPFTAPDGGDAEAWLANVNAELHVHDLAPIVLEDRGGQPFDQLSTALDQDGDDSGGREEPLVSVIVTTFNPGEVELKTSVRSILDQTHRNLEVILVDDESAPEHREIVDRVGEIDIRIRVVHAPKNGGTYRARNLGLSVATGEYVTGQDDDDWSHPQRISKQVEFLRTHDDAIGCRINSFTCLPTLSRVRVGYKPIGPNASSLMMRRETFLAAGGFLQARKAADTELHRRVERMTGKEVIDIAKPLAFVRIEPDSLSRSEFRAGWSHPARREFKFSYAHWHANARLGELAISEDETPPVHVPRRFRIDPSTFPERLDVVFAGDWRQYGGPQRSMLEEIRALTDRGYRVGMMQMEAPRFMTAVQKPLTPHIQALINDGTVTEVLYDDPIRVDLLILRYPPILQFAPVDRSALDVGRMVILANQAPSELDGSDVRYLVPDCTANARWMFTDDVLWVPQGPQARESIEPYLRTEELSSFDVPGLVDAAEWWNDHSERRSTLPVVGRHSRDNAMKWPEDPAVLAKVYPTSGRFDVRVLGGASVPRTVLGATVVPASWTVYETDALPVPTFLETLDFYVFYQNSIAVEAFGRSILEAIASGVVVILPPHYRDAFGEGALYAEPAEVQALVMKYHNDRDLYVEQTRRAATVVDERFSHDSYARRVKGLLERVRA